MLLFNWRRTRTIVLAYLRCWARKYFAQDGFNSRS